MTPEDRARLEFRASRLQLRARRHYREAEIRETYDRPGLHWADKNRRDRTMYMSVAGCSYATAREIVAELLGVSEED